MAKILTINYYEYEPATSKYSIGDRDIAFMYLGNNAVGSFSVQLNNSIIDEPPASQYATFTLTVNDSSFETGGSAIMTITNASETENYGTVEAIRSDNTIAVPLGETILVHLSTIEFSGTFSHREVNATVDIVDGSFDETNCVLLLNAMGDMLIQGIFSN